MSPLWNQIRTSSPESPTLYLSLIRHIFCDTMLRIATNRHGSDVFFSACYLPMDRHALLGTPSLLPAPNRVKSTFRNSSNVYKNTECHSNPRITHKTVRNPQLVAPIWDSADFICFNFERCLSSSWNFIDKSLIFLSRKIFLRSRRAPATLAKTSKKSKMYENGI